MICPFTMGSGVPQWPAMDEWRRKESRSDLSVIAGLYEVIIIFGCWGSHLDTGPVFHSKAHWTCTLARESPPVYILYYRRKWLWLHTQLAFQSCCHLVESQGPHRRWLKWENNIIYYSPIVSKGNKQYICFVWKNCFVYLSFILFW